MLFAHDDYDAVPYPGSAYPETHPGRLAAMGLLHGLDPAPVERCRVLEIGCNDGANLIPMAYGLPGGDFTGFDLAAQPIARAQQRIRELGLTNIRVFQGDLMDVESGLGTFDYVIAHGVYAWVPEAARDRLLALCRSHLAVNGIAFISYNAQPGGHFRNLVRDMLLQPLPPGEEGAPTDPTALLNFVIGARPEGDPYRALLETEAKQLHRKGSRVYFHDEMAAFNRPVSFTVFTTHAARHGLQYLSDSLLPPPNDPCYRPEVMATVKSLANGDSTAEEQMLDFVRFRMYRETLLCRAECGVDRDMRLEAFERLRLTTQAESTVAETGMRVFTRPGGQIESRHPATLLIMEHLMAACPESVSIRHVGEFLERNGVLFDAEVLVLLLRLIVSRIVQLQAWTAPVSSRIPERPQASAVSRHEAAVQNRAATLLHLALGLDDPIVRSLVLLMDGTKNRTGLLQALRLEHPDVSEATLRDGLEPSLRLLHRSGVLLAEPEAEIC